MKYLINALIIFLYVVLGAITTYLLYKAYIKDQLTIGIYAVCVAYSIYSTILLIVLYKIKKNY